MAHRFGLNEGKVPWVTSENWSMLRIKKPLNNLMLKMAIEPNVGLTFFSKFITRDIL